MNLTQQADMRGALIEVERELLEAMKRFPPMASPHEGWAVVFEELDELWDEVKVKQSQHNRAAMRKEAMQVAAMAVRFMVDLT